ncbi:receptor-type tyrosine-protein phosphatase kappa-like [Ylistrum balloti]|uniref:receptor-type tyrosine-protein phosphatase kappa-like n=1 Tax=Ylistrum balloti TaxID=509963 RepID=UPI00290592FA|nr:receptor-type tyrosine-protein phosphatase kappa-like [Ylistrum balloti]
MLFYFEDSKDGTGVAVGVVVGLGVVAIVIILVIIWRYKLRSTKEDSIDDPRGQELSQYRTSPRDNDENVTEPLTDSENVYINVVDPGVIGQVDCNVNPVGIAINDLKSVVNTKMLNQAKAFEDEYKSLPSGDLHEHKFAVLTENKHKNRYKAIFPYDHSRVILDSQDKDSDYINASYIDSVTQPAEYIATQGPTYKTIDDFWRMIWQLKSGKIVMLTNLEEGTKKKCEKYWPDEGEQMSTVHFSITLKKETGYAFYVIRDIIVTERETKSVRQIHQFHYTTWPDHGTPNPKELVVFHRRVRNYKTSLNGKMVFHCSAGIGRTGTFIALDALFHYGREFGIIDVMEYIVTMRKDRINMVQTSDQYIALHHILIEAFDMPDTLISRIKYHTSLDNLSGNGPRNQAKLWQEYQLLQTTRPVYTQEDYQTALLAVNNDKNVDPNILPVDKFRVYLMSYVSGRTDYINAVAVPSYTSGSGFIITQIPLEDTVIDLLTMLMDNQCDTIVIIGRDSLKWLPKEGIDETIGSFVLKHAEGASNLHNVDVLDIGVTNHSNHYDANVRIFCMTGWEGDIPLLSDSSTLLQLLERIDSRRKSNDTMRTVVMCRDGYTKSGLFCCIGNARDQMKMDDEVDIYQVSQQLIVRRPQCITNFEQYQYCYNVINEYLDNTDLYIN